MKVAYNLTDPKAAEKAAEAFGDLFGPGWIDQEIRQAIHYAWRSIPKKRRSIKELEKQIRRIVDRAVKDFREDQKAFGK